NLTPWGRFKPAAQLAAELPEAEAVVAYCGSGVTACHTILAYAVAGRPLPRLYPGSWSEWIRDPARPVAQGD
ncbi:MAG: sulfurtransferase, partial [Halomonas sp. BM-2019]